MLSHAEYAELWEFVFNDFKKRLRFYSINIRPIGSTKFYVFCMTNKFI